MLIPLISHREINANFSIQDTVMSANYHQWWSCERQPNCKSLDIGRVWVDAATWMWKIIIPTECIENKRELCLCSQKSNIWWAGDEKGLERECILGVYSAWSVHHTKKTENSESALAIFFNLYHTHASLQLRQFNFM